MSSKQMVTFQCDAAGCQQAIDSDSIAKGWNKAYEAGWGTRIGANQVHLCPKHFETESRRHEILAEIRQLLEAAETSGKGIHYAFEYDGRAVELIVSDPVSSSTVSSQGYMHTSPSVNDGEGHDQQVA